MPRAPETRGIVMSPGALMRVRGPVLEGSLGLIGA
jgi:hypothetical protein